MKVIELRKEIIKLNGKVTGLKKNELEVLFELIKKRNKIKDDSICSKCEGTGIIKTYSHRDNGRCYECQGTGKVITTYRLIKFGNEKLDIKSWKEYTSHIDLDTRPKYLIKRLKQEYKDYVDRIECSNNKIGTFELGIN